ncbi:DUF3221 domain-containing protein [Aureibacillus halotolerans]|uniref:Uncharacterized protein DUF3221 n=1 Tax=Aureibacillus halotolerans TaxID=1508390 RepID=A0A4R6U5I1_9BACI|nr:DUF3221 domain-containing protein [Aureibacillus halotolerans]TDQ41006.1 uncharacterized protein DUF3221 [Aureibacillus halotolerans]
MKIHLIVFIAMLPLFLLACEKTAEPINKENQISGYVVDKRYFSEDEFQLLVSQGITLDELSSYTSDELLSHSTYKTNWIYVEKLDYREVKKGEKVLVTLKNYQLEISPPMFFAEQIKSID